MEENLQELHARLLREWQYKRELVKYYSSMLQRLDLRQKDARERWTELNEKLLLVFVGLQHVSDQLSACEVEQPKNYSNT